MLTDHNNIRRFMDTKSLSSRQVCWAQELSRYHFRTDYRQGKANGAADAYLMKIEAEERETNIMKTIEKDIMNNVETYTILI